MLVDKQSELMSDLLFTVHQHGGDDVTWKPPILKCGTEPIWNGDRRDAALLRYRSRVHIAVVMCDQKPYPVWLSCWRKIFPV